MIRQGYWGGWESHHSKVPIDWAIIFFRNKFDFCKEVVKADLAAKSLATSAGQISKYHNLVITVYKYFTFFARMILPYSTYFLMTKLMLFRCSLMVVLSLQCLVFSLVILQLSMMIIMKTKDWTLSKELLQLDLFLMQMGRLILCFLSLSLTLYVSLFSVYAFDWHPSGVSDILHAHFYSIAQLMK